MGKRYNISQIRMRLAEALDSAERGESVIVERRGVRFTIAAARIEPRRPRRPLIEICDPDVAAGRWTWAEGPGGLTFAGAGRKKRA